MKAKIPNVLRRYPAWVPCPRSDKKSESFTGREMEWKEGVPSFFPFLCLCVLLGSSVKKVCSTTAKAILTELGQTYNGKNNERVYAALRAWRGLRIDGEGIFQTIAVDRGKIDLVWSESFLRHYSEGWTMVDTKEAQKVGAMSFKVQDFVKSMLEGRKPKEKIVFGYKFLAQKLGIEGRYPREVSSRIDGGCQELARTMGLKYGWENGMAAFYLEPILTLASEDTTFFGCEPTKAPAPVPVVEKVPAFVAAPVAPVPAPAVLNLSNSIGLESGGVEKSSCYDFEEDMGRKQKFNQAFELLEKLPLPLPYLAKSTMQKCDREVIAHAAEFSEAFMWEFLERPAGAPRLKATVKMEDCGNMHRKITSFFQNCQKTGKFDWGYFPNYRSWKLRQDDQAHSACAPKIADGEKRAIAADRSSQVAEWISGVKSPSVSWCGYMVHGEDAAKDLILGDLIPAVPGTVVPWKELSPLVLDREFRDRVFRKIPSDFWERMFSGIQEIEERKEKAWAHVKGAS